MRNRLSPAAAVTYARPSGEFPSIRRDQFTCSAHDHRQAGSLLKIRPPAPRRGREQHRSGACGYLPLAPQLSAAAAAGGAPGRLGVVSLSLGRRRPHRPHKHKHSSNKAALTLSHTGPTAAVIRTPRAAASVFTPFHPNPSLPLTLHRAHVCGHQYTDTHAVRERETQSIVW